MKSLRGITIAVTGAAGFIGCRTVEHLVLGTECRVHALVRSFSRLGRLAELPQERLDFFAADLLDGPALEDAFRVCDVVIHCAFGNKGEPEDQWLVTVEGTRCVVEAGKRQAVKRLVHLSTAAVHDCSGVAQFDEQTPWLDAPALSYEAAKLEAERIVFGAGIESILLRPTVVYGPWGNDWTIRPIQRIQRGVFGLPSAPDEGASNAVYVDDVVQAILLSCVCQATGSLLIASDEPVSWGQFYDAFRALLPVVPTPSEAEAPEAVESWEADLYRQPARACIGKATKTIGFRPRTLFRDGMSMVGAWGRWQGLVPQP